MYKNGERCMAWVSKIEEISNIPGADAIDAYRVGGWWVVDKKNAYQIGDWCIYISIDSWVPHDIAPFLSKGQEPREYNGVKGARLRTVTLRGQLSQGLLVPFTATMAIRMGAGPGARFSDYENRDVTQFLGIQKYEAPIPAQLAGQVRGMFPDFIPKTDQERIQNLTTELNQWKNTDSLHFEITEKLNGSSMTVYVYNNDSGVCSRNLNLKEDANNTLWKVAKKNELIEKIRDTGRNLALQGELIGEGIQGNPYKIKGQDFYLFDVYDIDHHRYLTPLERRVFADSSNIKHVPVFAKEKMIVESVDALLLMAEGKSVLNDQTEREGFVFKCNSTNDSFKVISNQFLMKTGN